MKYSDPLISCICITKERPALLLQAIGCFLAQSYLNKQLIISFPADDIETTELSKGFTDRGDVKILFIQRAVTDSLGEARNQAIFKAAGDYICIWDDDDWYHPERLQLQYDLMQTSDHKYYASVLTRIILYDKTTESAYYSFSYTWDGTLLCRKEILMQNQYAFLNKAEDTHIIKFLDGKRWLHYIEEHPYLYIYIYHGTNSWNYEHFKYFTDKSELLDQQTMSVINGLLTNQK